MKRAFIHLSRAWYGPAMLMTADSVDDLYLGYARDEDGPSGEVCVRWYQLGQGAPAPRLEVFDDSWRVLWEFRDVLEMLAGADGKNITPEELCRALMRLGFQDETPVNDDKRESLREKIQALVAQERR